MPEKPTHQHGEFDDDEDYEYDDDFDDDSRYDFEVDTHRALVEALELILETGSADPADDVVDQLAAVRPGDGPALGELIAVSALVEFHHGPLPPDPRAAVRWVADRLGLQAGQRALTVAALLGHPDAPPWPHLYRDDSALPEVLLLLAGAVAVAADTPVPYPQRL